MSKAIPKECMALLKEASEMFSETGCVPGIDGEEVPAETIVPDAKEYILETINDPEALYDPESARMGTHWTSLASNVIVVLSTLDTGQFFSASPAIRAKAASSRFGTFARRVSAERLMRKPWPSGSSVTADRKSVV